MHAQLKGCRKIRKI